MYIPITIASQEMKTKPCLCMTKSKILKEHM